MDDDKTQDKGNFFLPGKATFFSTTKHPAAGHNHGSNGSMPTNANTGANQDTIQCTALSVAPILPTQATSSSCTDQQSTPVDNTQSNLGPTQASAMPPTNQDTTLVPPSATQTQSAVVPTSDKLTPTDLTHLQQPVSPTPSLTLTLTHDLRSEVIVDFYDTFVEANTRIPGLSSGLEVQLLQECVLAGTAPFWNDFMPLSAVQLADMAKKFEALVVLDLQKKVGNKTMGMDRQVMEYRKLASKLGISPNAPGMERFAREARKVHERERS